MWDGGTAHQLGLVDGFGGMPDAIAKAAELAKLGKDERASATSNRPELPRPAVRIARGRRRRCAAGTRSAPGRRPQQQLADAMAEVRSILSGPSIQARCLECPGAPAPMPARDRSLLALVEEWLS